MRAVHGGPRLWLLPEDILHGIAARRPPRKPCAGRQRTGGENIAAVAAMRDLQALLTAEEVDGVLPRHVAAAQRGIAELFVVPGVTHAAAAHHVLEARASGPRGGAQGQGGAA